MRYIQLRAFHNVAVHGGFSKAAEQLAITQPAISDHVRRLEEEYDILLFDRSKKQVALTSFGRQLLDITRHLFDVEKQARDILSEKRALRSGTLRIIADSPHHLLHVLAAFRKKYPGILVSLRAGNTNEVVSALSSYQADIGVLGEVPAGQAFNIVRLNSTPVVAFASKDFPLQGEKAISLEQLATLPLVLREPGSKTRQILERFARDNNIPLKATIEAEGREAVREIVASGAGIGFVSGAEFGYDRRLVQIPVEGLDRQMEEALICLKDRENSRLIRTFMGVARPA
ncbi:MAG TPA: LysR family transcriptional regulator [Devosia sp.]|nr:LysR family transcriptional regulator [Devosia sp.]